MIKVSPGLLRNPVHCLSLGCGAGLFPKAPGTAGTLVGIPLFLFMHPLPLEYYLLNLLILYVIGVCLCAHTARKLGVHDHPAIVFDEIVGYLVTMIAVPMSVQTVVLGFVLFRIFDIFKPWPIRWLDRSIKGGTGIMLDDVVAGLFALGCMHVVISFGLVPGKKEPGQNLVSTDCPCCPGSAYICIYIHHIPATCCTVSVVAGTAARDFQYTD